MLCVSASKLKGSLKIPPSKSHTLRAIVFAALAKSPSCIENYLESPDTDAMIKAVQAMGAIVRKTKTELHITPNALKTPNDVMDCGNSGIVLRFITAISALCPGYTILTGDRSIKENRSVAPLLNALNQLGATAISTRDNGKAPLIVKGPILHHKAKLDGADSQPVSALLIAGAFGPHAIDITVDNPGEKPWIDLTCYWLEKLGIAFERDGYHFYRVFGNAAPKGFHYRVPGDFSSMAFPLAAAIVTQSKLELEGIDMDDVQGDKQILHFLKEMGAVWRLKEDRLTIFASSLKGAKLDVNSCIDALPILAVLGCYAEGQTELYNAKVARLKESDRIASIVEELKKMGADIEETDDGLIVRKSTLQGASLHSHDDHRIAMSLCVAALGAEGKSHIHATECIAKTYLSFEKELKLLGAFIA